MDYSDDELEDEKRRLKVIKNFTLNDLSREQREKAQRIVKSTFINLKPVAHTAEVTKILINPLKDQLFSSSRDGSIILWDLSTKKQVKTVLKGSTPIKNIQLTKDNRFLLVSTSQELLYIIQLDLPFQNLEVLKGSEGTVLANFSKCTMFLACLIGLFKIIIWDFRKREQIKSFSIENESVINLSFAADSNKLLVLTESSQIITFDFLNEKIEKQDKSSINFIATGNLTKKYATASIDGFVFLHLDEMVTQSEDPHLSFIACLEFNNSDEYLISSSFDKTIKIYQTSFPMQTIKVIKSHSTALTFAFLIDLSKIYMGFKVNEGQNTIREFNIKENKFLEGFNGHSSSLKKIIFYRGFSKVLTDAEDGALRLWDLDSDMQLKSINVKLGFRDYSLSFNEKMIVFSGKEKIFIWDTEENTLIFSVPFEYYSLVSVFFSCFDKFVVAHTSNALTFVNVDNQVIVKKIQYNKIWVNFSIKINEKIFIQNFNSGKIAKVWVVEEQKQEKCMEIKGFNSPIQSGVFSKSRNYLVLATTASRYLVLKIGK